MIDAECVHFLSIGDQDSRTEDNISSKHVKKMAGRVGYRSSKTQQPCTKYDKQRDEIEVDYRKLGGSTSASESCFSGAKGWVLKVLLVVTLFSVGIIVGFIIHRNVHHRHNSASRSRPALVHYSGSLSESLLSRITAANIERNLKDYTQEVHLTATQGNTLLGDLLKSQLQSMSYDVGEPTYKVLLSYPDLTNPGFVAVVNGTGSEVFRNHYTDPMTDVHPEYSEQYNAFSPNGSVQGELIYGNYGEMGDFTSLKAQGIECQGKIIIMKYGKIFRGLKVENAAKCGAAGVILYPDPAEVTGQSQSKSDLHPNTWFLPGFVTQVGSVLPEIEGDPLTPGLPSLEVMHRLDESEAALPTIPTHPIGWKDAQLLINKIKEGQPKNVTTKEESYSFPNSRWRVQLNVHNFMQQRQIRNVIGVMKGHVEPDRYVIIGCHYDAWYSGGVDPNSGTAILTEVARAFSDLAQTGWKPFRTLIFAHFDAEEQGLFGSYEWVEENEKELAERTVIFINLDGAVRGNWSMDVQASSLLHDVITDVMDMIQSPRGKKSVYEEWKADFSFSEPKWKEIKGGSDQAPFVFILGVPAMWPRYYRQVSSHSAKSYPAYHSAIDTFEYVKQFVDPHFTSHHVLAKVVAELVLRLTTDTKLPYNTSRFCAFIENLMKEMISLMADNLPPNVTPYFEQLNYAVGNLSLYAADFQSRFEEIDKNNLFEVRQYNDRLLRLQQAFIYSPGLPNRPMFRNLLFAPSAVDSSGGATLTGIYDAYLLYLNSTKADEPQLRKKAGQEVERQLSILLVAVNSAISVLQDNIVTRIVL